MNNIPNWVERRAQNRMQKVFEELRKIVERDVKEMNTQVEKAQAEDLAWAYREMRLCSFFLPTNRLSQIVVQADPTNYTYQGCGAEFVYDENATTIRVTTQIPILRCPGHFERITFTVASGRWQKKEQTYWPCIEGTPCPIWEISRRALEPVFFIAPEPVKLAD